MALNPASHNTPGIKTGPASEPPPPTSGATTEALLAAAKEDPMGQHEGGADKVGEGALEGLEGEGKGKGGGGE